MSISDGMDKIIENLEKVNNEIRKIPLSTDQKKNTYLAVGEAADCPDGPDDGI